MLSIKKLYKKRYSIKNLKNIFAELSTSNRTYLSISEILDEIQYDPLDIQEFFIKNIKHRFRYERKT